MTDTFPLSFDAATPDGHNATLDEPISPDGRPEPGRRYTVPARCGRAVRLAAGEILTIVNPAGSQVCDFWAFALPDLREFLSMEHLRTALGRTMPRPGDGLVTNLRRSLMTVTEDTSPGIHDTVVAACDLHRYRQLGVEEYHDNCTDNLRMALMAIGMRAPEIPAPFNIWMNVPVDPRGGIEFQPPVSKPGDSIRLRADRDCIAVMSACPQDKTPVNGAEATPQPLMFDVTR